MASVALKSKSVGTTVKLNVNNSLREFVVVQHGRPSSMYDNGWDNVTILLMKEIYENRQWHSSSANAYESSTIHSYLNSTFINLLDTAIRNSLVSVKLPYRAGTTGTAITSGASGLAAKVFLLSGYEVGFTVSDNRYFVADGARFSYFQDGAAIAANNLRIAYLNGSVGTWWLRSPNSGGATYAFYVNTDGASGNGICSSTLGVRPALALPSSLLVSDSGTVETNSPPTTPSSLTLPTTIKGGVTFGVSWGTSTDPDGNLQGYQLEREINGTGNWVQVYMGSARTTTDFLAYGVTTVRYRVRAYDTQGAYSSYRTSASQTVISNTAPTAPPSITVPLQVVGGENIIVSWGASSDAEGNLSGYELERSDNGGGYAQKYRGPNQTHTDNVAAGIQTVQYRVRAFDALGEYSDYTIGSVRNVDNNAAPVISCGQSGDIGVKSEGFSVSYTVADPDGDAVTVVEAVDGLEKRTYTATLGAENTFEITGDYFMQILNGEHTLTVTATDTGGKSAKLTLTWTKAVHALRITLESPMQTDDLIQKMIMNVVREIPADAAFEVLVTNNANDPSPAWEDATASVTSGINYLFQNTNVANGHAFNFIITAERGSSGLAGYISSIGGAFE